MEKENQEMYQWLMRNEMEKQQGGIEEEDEAMTELKLVEQQPLMNQLQFSFYGDDEELQLGTNLPFHTHTNYRLQPTHPNLQD